MSFCKHVVAKVIPVLCLVNSWINTVGGHNYSPPWEISIHLHVLSYLQEKYSDSSGQHIFPDFGVI